jgi:hypothetical protein
MTSLYADLISDLEDARKASLLIEIQKKHIDQIIQEKSDFVLEHYCKNIYNKDLSATKTNVIFIDAKRGAQAQILATLYTQLGGRLKSEKSLESALKLGVFFATLGLSDLVDSSITDSVSDFLRESIDVIDGPASRWVGDKAEAEAIEAAEGNVDKILNAVSHRDNAELYLSKDAGKKLLEFATKLSRSHTAHEAMQFMVEFILSLGIGAPKLLVINDPFSLDAESLSLCSLLFSHAKDLKLQGEEAPISVVFNYTAQQPYEANVKNEKNAASLFRLRQMTQRYGMLEKPGSSIPRPAIKSTTFVGRESELIQLKRDHDSLLETLAQDKSKLLNQWTIIKGEPGTGKTALINKYLSETARYEDAQSTSQIRLRLLNQIGHSSEVTGLASLLQSIQSEANRLTLYYEAKTEFRWNEMGQGIGRFFLKKINAKIDSVKQVAIIGEEVAAKKQLSFDQFKKAAKAIASLASHDTFYGSVEAAKDRYSLNKSKLQTADAFNEGGSRNQKQEQFDKLVSALRHLQQIAKAVSSDTDQLPIMLFIDDLQWIDELSAEFILTRFVGAYPIEFLITARESDSQSSYKLAEAQSEYAPFKLKFFDMAQLGITINPNQFEDTYYTPHQRIMTPIKVLGMDRSTLANLINTVYGIDDKLNIGVITDALINALSEKHGEENAYVNTLFVVETLNLLSDPAFYRRFVDIKPLFVKNDTGGYTINVSSEVAFTERVEQVFERLKKAHKSAYHHDSMKGSEGHQFTLSSYAVMEERLFIIHQYFAEYGDIATFTLQLSSLLSTPFNSDLVQSIIAKIKAIDETSLPELLPIKAYLNKQQGECLTPEHYELLEEVFEIIRRLPNLDNLHQYRHGLFSTFLRQQTLYTLHAIFSQDESQSRLDCFFEFTNDCIISELKKITGETSVSSLHFNRASLLEEARTALLHLAYETHPERWVKDYTVALNNLGLSYTKVNRVPDAIELFEQSLAIVKPLYEKHSDCWEGDYTMTLNSLGAGYEMANRVLNAIEFFEQALEILERLHEMHPEQWVVRYNSTLNNLGLSYIKVNLVPNAINLLEKSLAIVEPLYNWNPDAWESDYIMALNNLATSYQEDNRFQDAIRLFSQSLRICENLYKKVPKRWVGDYTKGLNNLGLAYELMGGFPEAIELLEKSREILEELYDEHPERWVKGYNSTLNNLGVNYTKVNSVPKAIELFEKSLAIVEPLYDEQSECWAGDYVLTLNNLAISHEKAQRFQDTIRLFEQSLRICEYLYEREPKRWAGDYAIVRSNLAASHDSIGNVIDSIKIDKQSLVIYKMLYEEHSERWVGEYTAVLNRLSFSYKKDNSIEKAIEVAELSLVIVKPLFQENFGRWQGLYFTNLRNLADVKS